MTEFETVPLQNLPTKVPPHAVSPRSLSLKNLLESLRRCSHPNPSIREKALDGLLQPQAVDEASYARDLLAIFAEQPWLMRHMAPPLAGLFLDVATLTGGKPWVSGHAAFFTKFLDHLGKRPFLTLLRQSHPLMSFLPCISQRAIRAGIPPSRNFGKNRWRLLRKRLLSLPGEISTTALTLRDLYGLTRGIARLSRPSHRGPRWLSVGRLLILQDRKHGPISLEPDGRLQSGIPSLENRVFMHRMDSRPLAWGTMRPSAMRSWEAIEKAQAGELAAMRTLSRAVSRRTRRAVLSLHNATLAAAGGWAWEDPLASIDKPALQEGFITAVERRSRELAASCGSLPVTPMALWSRWEERLVVPPLRHALWEGRVRATFDPGWARDHERELWLVERTLGNELMRGTLDDAVATHALPGALAPHQRRTVEEILRWRDGRRELWSEGLFCLAAMIAEGQGLLDSGDLECLVLPWIDKFFISSRRQADRDYLPLTLQFLGALGAQPLVLFWEDTCRAADPSFKLALNAMRRRGHPFRGIGVFDDGTSRRDEALDLICREHPATRLFALRPLGDAHTPSSLHRLLEGGLSRFLPCYDSSWKDNLCFIYAGTQVLPFVSVQCEMEPFPAWVVAGHCRIPFGTAFRRRLRRKVLGTRDAMVHPLSLRYAQWANLL